MHLKLSGGWGVGVFLLFLVLKLKLKLMVLFMPYGVFDDLMVHVNGV